MLTQEEYQTRRSELETALAEKRAAYEAAALSAAGDPNRGAARSRLRNDLVDLQTELDDLDAAWRAAQREHAKLRTADGLRERQEAAATSAAALQDSARLAEEFERSLDEVIRIAWALREARDKSRGSALRHAPTRADYDGLDRALAPFLFGEIESWLEEATLAVTDGSPRKTPITRIVAARVERGLAALPERLHIPTEEEVAA